MAANLKGRLVTIVNYVKFSWWKGQFWIQEVIRARLDTGLRPSSINYLKLFHPVEKFEKQVTKLDCLKYCR